MRGVFIIKHTFILDKYNMNMSSECYFSVFYYLYFNIIYYFFSGVLFLVDYFGVCCDAKIQKKKISLVMHVYRKCIWLVLKNTLIYLIPVALCLGNYTNTYIDTHVVIFPQLFDWISQLFFSFVLTDLFFYIAHRTLHLPIFYKRVHKKHHEITAPIGLSALYMSVLDLWFGNVLPVILPIYIVGMHPYIIIAWLWIIVFNTIILAHSGFNCLANFHDKHHEVFNKNYGINIYMDRLFNTYDLHKKIE